MHLGFSLPPAAGFEQLLGQVLSAEAAGLDFVWLPEGMTPLGVERRLPYEATLLAAALAARTSRIGLLVTAAPARHEPYNLARRLASLDWISKGRIGWMIDAGSDAGREEEYVGLVGDLWDSWDDDAFVYDKAAGRFFAPGKMHVLDHKGPHFSVRGPLNVNRPPQGRPAVASLAGAPLARRAELVLLPEDASGPSPEDGSARHARFLASWSDLEGPPPALADRLEGECDRRRLDGFVLVPASPADLRGFIDRVVPELARRNLVGATQGARTLRDRLGVPRPALPAKLEASG